MLLVELASIVNVINLTHTPQRLFSVAIYNRANAAIADIKRLK